MNKQKQQIKKTLIKVRTVGRTTACDQTSGRKNKQDEWIHLNAHCSVQVAVERVIQKKK